MVSVGVAVGLPAINIAYSVIYGYLCSEVNDSGDHFKVLHNS